MNQLAYSSWTHLSRMLAMILMTSQVAQSLRLWCGGMWSTPTGSQRLCAVEQCQYFVADGCVLPFTTLVPLEAYGL